jgi:hypothetical protein
MLKLKKLKCSIKYYNPILKTWESFFDGSEEETTNTWQAMLCGFCVDDLLAIERKLNI